MKQPTKQFALCVDNEDYEVALTLGKVYPIVPDARAAKDDFVRIVDESGEDYLYHKSHFVFVDFPSPIRKRILALTGPPITPLQTDERRAKVVSKRQPGSRAARG